MPPSPSMDVTPPSSMQRFMIRVGLAKKKVQRQSSFRHGRTPSRSRSRWAKGRPVSSVAAKESVKSARHEGPLARRSTSKSVESDPSSLNGEQTPLAKSPENVSLGQNLTRTTKPKRANTFFGTLTNKLRVRAPATRHTLDSEHVKVQSSQAQAVSITLPNDIASRERRANALRSRGLLPPRLQALSAIEAAEDSRIDALRANEPSLLSPDSTHSDARDIAQSWRSGNSMWLSLGPMTPLDLVPEVLISPIDESSDCLKLSTEEVDPAASGPRGGPSSVPKSLPTGLCNSPDLSIRTASPAESKDNQEARPSGPTSIGSPSSDGPKGLGQDSALDSPRSEEDLSAEKPQTEIVGDAEKQSSPSVPSFPLPSEGPSSCSQQSHFTEENQIPSVSSSERPASPSGISRDSPTPRSPRLPPSPRSVSSPGPAPTSPLPATPDLSASPQISFPDAPPLRLCASGLDTLMASPTSPTVPSLLCSSSSEMSHSSVFTDNGETLASPASYSLPVKGRRANLSPIAVKSTEGGFLCEEVILETTESFPEDDLDPFAGPSSTAPADLKVDVSAANASRSKPFTFLGLAKKRASTLDTSSNAGISKSASMANLRRSMTSAFQTRARPCSTLSPIDQSPPLSPLTVTMHNSATILAEASLIDDDEIRRLSELAFM